jgi:hypothetical protein
MQLLGMKEFAAHLHSFIESILESLITDRDDYAHLLRSISSKDPILYSLACITAQKMHTRLYLTILISAPQRSPSLSL